MRMNETERMSVREHLSLSHVLRVCLYDDACLQHRHSIKSKPNSKWNPLISSENEPCQKGARKSDSLMLWGDRTREAMNFYHFISEHEAVVSSNKQQTKRTEVEEKSLIRDVRRIQFWIKLWRQCRRFGVSPFFWKLENSTVDDDGWRWKADGARFGM